MRRKFFAQNTVGTFMNLKNNPLVGGIAVVALLGFIAMLCLVQAYSIGEAAIVAPMQYSQIIWATGFGALLFGETIKLTTLIGAAIIIGSGIMIVMREAKGGRSENTPVMRTRSRPLTPGGMYVSYLLKRSHKGPQAEVDPDLEQP